VHNLLLIQQANTIRIRRFRSPTASAMPLFTARSAVCQTESKEGQAAHRSWHSSFPRQLAPVLHAAAPSAVLLPPPAARRCCRRPSR